MVSNNYIANWEKRMRLQITYWSTTCYLHRFSPSQKSNCEQVSSLALQYLTFFTHLTLNATRFQSLKFKPAFYLSLLISIQCLINSVYHEFLSLFIETTTYMQGAWLKYSFFCLDHFSTLSMLLDAYFLLISICMLPFSQFYTVQKTTENLLNGILIPKRSWPFVRKYCSGI